MIKALDLFCGAGGVTKGLQRAGFHVTGIDLHRQPRYCGDAFVQADALRPPFDLKSFDFIWASPPCQHYSIAAQFNRSKGEVYPDLLSETRAGLEKSSKPYIIENVPGAPMRGDVMLCGSMFGLNLVRHRYFETNILDLILTPPCQHSKNPITVCGTGTPSWARRRRKAKGLNDYTSKDRKDAMDIQWMTGKELSQAIPPAYSEFLGKQIIRACFAQQSGAK